MSAGFRIRPAYILVQPRKLIEQRAKSTCFAYQPPIRISRQRMTRLLSLAAAPY